MNMLLSCLLNASKGVDPDEIAALLKHRIKKQEVCDVALQQISGHLISVPLFFNLENTDHGCLQYLISCL